MDVCDGTAVNQMYWNDEDGDGLGAGTEQEYCSAEVPDGWVLNDDDDDDTCYSNDHDCAGDCIVGDDLGAEFNFYYTDADGDGLGTGNSVYLCGTYAPSDMVTNNLDEDDACWSNIHDCAGVCDGTDVVDCADVCGGTSTISNLSDGCDLPESVTTAYFALKDDGTVYFRSPQVIAGFEFILDDVSDDMNISMSGGQAGAAGAYDNLNCIQNINGAFCMGFNFMGTPVAAGCGVLINVSAGICSGADTDADGTCDITQPVDEASCLDPAGDNTGTAGTWTSSSFTTLSQIVVSDPSSNIIVTEAYCSE
jgi:hypothetical protein